MKTTTSIRLLIVLLLLAAGAWSMVAAEEELPRLKDEDVLAGHSKSPITSLEFSPDGKKLLSMEPPSKARLWDITGRKTVAVFQHFEPVVKITPTGQGKIAGMGGGCIHAAIFSPDGKSIATSGLNGKICIWNVADGKKNTSLSVGQYYKVTALAYSPDCKKLTGVGKYGFRVWEVEKGIKLHDYETPLMRVPKLRVPLHFVRADASIKQHLVAYGVPGGSVVLDAFSGERAVFCRHREGVGCCFALNRDETRLAAGAYREPLVWIWDRTSGDCLATFKTPPILLRCVVFSPDGTILAAGYQQDYYRKPGSGHLGGVLIFEVSSGKLLADHDARIAAVHSLAFSPDGRLLATGDATGIIKLWTVPAAWRKQK